MKYKKKLKIKIIFIPHILSLCSCYRGCLSNIHNNFFFFKKTIFNLSHTLLRLFKKFLKRIFKESKVFYFVCRASAISHILVCIYVDRESTRETRSWKMLLRKSFVSQCLLSMYIFHGTFSCWLSALIHNS